MSRETKEPGTEAPGTFQDVRYDDTTDVTTEANAEHNTSTKRGPSMFTVYADVAADYLAAGWNPIPSDPKADNGKSGIPAGFTGYRGRNVTTADIRGWLQQKQAEHNLAVRMPLGVVGIDVDQYVKNNTAKKGAENLAALEEQLGTLPPTWASTSRPGTASGIWFYRIPVGVKLKANPTDAVELIQHHHRYALVWPSLHPEGREYRWYDESGELAERIPDVDDLAELPWPWVQHLTVTTPDGMNAATPEAVAAFIEEHTSKTNPAKLAKGITAALSKAKQGSRHDTLVSVACLSMREAAEGNYPASDAIELLDKWWRRVMADDPARRDGDEFGSAILWAVGQVPTTRPTKTTPPTPDTVTNTPPTPADLSAILEPFTGQTLALSDEWWTSRPVLEHIRTAARARRVGPAAVLGCVLARLAAFVPPSHCVPGLVGGTVPLSLYVALVADVGGGKSSPQAVAAALLGDTPAGCVGPLPLGSGEGVADSYLEQVDADDGTKKKVRRKTKHGALFTLDEGRVLVDIGSRSGSTLVPTLLTAWTGGEIGQANASAERFRHIEAGSYAVGMIALWQPLKMGPLFDAHDGGLPQRFLFVPTGDPEAPDTRPDWPGALNLEPLPVITSGGRIQPSELDYHPDIIEEVDAARLARLRGEGAVGPLDEHRNLLRLKVAGLLAILDGGRKAVHLDDWQLAGELLDVSTSLRARAWNTITVEAMRRESEATRKHVNRAKAVDDDATQRAFESALRQVVNRCWRDSADVIVSRRDLSRAIASKHRVEVVVDDVIAAAVRAGHIEETEGGYRQGRKAP